MEKELLPCKSKIGLSICKATTGGKPCLLRGLRRSAGELGVFVPGALRLEGFGEEAGAVAEVAIPLGVLDREPVQALQPPFGRIRSQQPEGAAEFGDLAARPLGEGVVGALRPRAPAEL